MLCQNCNQKVTFVSSSIDERINMLDTDLVIHCTSELSKKRKREDNSLVDNNVSLKKHKSNQ